MPKNLFPFINIPSKKPNSVFMFSNDIVARPFINIPSKKPNSVFMFSNNIVARPFIRNIFSPKIINWRLPDQTIDTEFNFVDGTDFDFIDGTDFDFVG